MVTRILIALVVFVILASIIAFFATDRRGEIAERKDSYPNPLAFLQDDITSSASSSESVSNLDSVSVFELPSFPESYFPSIGLSDSSGSGLFISSDPENESFVTVQNELLDLEEGVDDIQRKIDEAKVFGTPSPMRDRVQFSKFTSGTRKSNPQSEYITISASNINTAPIKITGWSLQSMLTGLRIYIGVGVRTLKMGQIGSVSDIYLDPGENAIIVSGISPVGTSFRENTCTGYLEQFQEFGPDLSRTCPSPSEELPNTLDNLLRYKAECLDFVETLSQCEYYLDSFPPYINLECQSFVKNALTYNGCVERHQWRPSFSLGDWRVFLNSRHELWHNSRDVIRLLDDRGRTVDAFSY